MIEFVQKPYSNDAQTFISKGKQYKKNHSFDITVDLIVSQMDKS